MILDASGNRIAGAEPETTRTVEETEEVVRSFSGSIQCERFDPRLKYEKREFFCSHKTRCVRGEEAATAKRVYEFCRDQVTAEMVEYAAGLTARFARSLKSMDKKWKMEPAAPDVGVPDGGDAHQFCNERWS